MPEQELSRGLGRSLVQRMVVPVKEVPLHSVVVYRDRAEVKRSVSVKLETGENEVVVSRLAECVDKNSLRVEGLGKSAGVAVITDVVYSSETKTLHEEEQEGSEEEAKTEYESLKASIQEKEKELKHLQFKGAVLVEEKELLQQFASHITKVHGQKKGGGDEDEGSVLPQLLEGPTMAAMMEFMERYQEKLSALDGRILEGQTQQQQLQEKIKALQANADKMNPEKKGKETETVHSVTISLEASEVCDVVLLVSYVVSNASWSSSYDVRVFTKDKTMKVQYYGLIKQSTGEDWGKASIALSTAQPSIGGSAPHLPTRIIRFKRPKPVYRERYKAKGRSAFALRFDPVFLSARRFKWDAQESPLYVEPRHMYGGEFNGDTPREFAALSLSAPSNVARRRSSGASTPPPALAVDTAKAEAGLFNTTFNIPRTTTIPADNTEHKVTVALIDLEPQFHHVSVPRLSPYSFLQAKAKNTSSYTMLAGSSNVFLDNNFIAKSELSDVSPSEQFTTSLGADQAVRITCQPVAVVHSNTRGLTKNKLLTYVHVIKVKNTHAEEVNIEVSEQVPLSTDDRIEVNVTEPDLKKQGVPCQLPFGHALLNNSNNIEWHATVGAEKELELRLVYTVEHPPQDAVEGLPKL